MLQSAKLITYLEQHGDRGNETNLAIDICNKTRVIRETTGEVIVIVSEPRLAAFVAPTFTVTLTFISFWDRSRPARQ